MRPAIVYCLCLGLAVLELLVALSPRGHQYNGVGAALALGLLVLLRA